MTRNTDPRAGRPDDPPHRRDAFLHGRSVVLVGLMGAGKTAVGQLLAARLGLPFADSDAAIERAAGCTVAEIFARDGEPAFRRAEAKTIAALLRDGPLVLATGGGAFMDPATRAVIAARAVSVWLRCDLPTLLRRTGGRRHRPLLNAGDPAETLARLMAARHPVYARADLVADSADESKDAMAEKLETLLRAPPPIRRVPVPLAGRSYDVAIGPGLIARAGAHLAPILPQPRAMVVTDATVAPLHLPALLRGLSETGIAVGEPIVIPAGEASKSLEWFGRVAEALLAGGVERRTAVVALGGGVVGDLAGFAAAAALRGLPFVQIPTTLLAQVDSSVGGKTGINSRYGKNLIGAFHQPIAVLADTDALATLPPRALRAGYAEIAKAGLIGDPALFAWCEANAAALLAGDAAIQAEAVARACAFKAAVVCADERETSAQDGRALLNLGHTFAHALEAEYGYGEALLHGEAVAVGIGLAFALSARLGLCDPTEAAHVVAHFAAAGLPATLDALNRRLSATRLVTHMRRDKKMRDGMLHFVLARGIGCAFTSSDIPEAEVLGLLRKQGCDA